jgi:hypothetical protein
MPRHARRISTRLTGGTKTPIDLRASPVHDCQRTVRQGKIVSAPIVATAAERYTERGTRDDAGIGTAMCASMCGCGIADMKEPRNC